MSSFNIKFAAVSIMTLSLTGISGALADGASCAAGNVSQSTLRTELYQISQLVNAACVSRGQLPPTLADAGYVPSASIAARFTTKLVSPSVGAGNSCVFVASLVGKASSSKQSASLTYSINQDGFITGIPQAKSLSDYFKLVRLSLQSLETAEQAIYAENGSFSSDLKSIGYSDFKPLALYFHPLSILVSADGQKFVATLAGQAGLMRNRNFMIVETGKLSGSSTSGAKFSFPQFGSRAEVVLQLKKLLLSMYNVEQATFAETGQYVDDPKALAAAGFLAPDYLKDFGTYFVRKTKEGFTAVIVGKNDMAGTVFMINQAKEIIESDPVCE